MQDDEALASLYAEVGRHDRLEEVLRKSRASSNRTHAQMLAAQKRPTQKNSKYEPSASGREGWWRVSIKDTPIPGTYETHLNTFIKEVVARPMTYGFKSDGRRRDPQPLEPKGQELLPGAYSVQDSFDEMSRRRLSYGFKSPQREESLKKTVLGNHDKDIDLAPGLYETQKYHRIEVPVERVKHSFFKSKSGRKIFTPQTGPAPSDYEPKTKLIDPNDSPITSSFRSRTDRFRKRSLNVPGPGSYTALTGIPPWRQIDSYSAYGVFFSANFSQRKPTSV